MVYLLGINRDSPNSSECAIISTTEKYTLPPTIMAVENGTLEDEFSLQRGRCLGSKLPLFPYNKGMVINPTVGVYISKIPY